MIKTKTKLFLLIPVLLKIAFTTLFIFNISFFDIFDGCTIFSLFYLMASAYFFLETSSQFTIIIPFLFLIICILWIALFVLLICKKIKITTIIFIVLNIVDLACLILSLINMFNIFKIVGIVFNIFIVLLNIIYIHSSSKQKTLINSTI